jgi:hypothetical protein
MLAPHIYSFIKPKIKMKNISNQPNGHNTSTQAAPALAEPAITHANKIYLSATDTYCLGDKLRLTVKSIYLLSRIMIEEESKAEMQDINDIIHLLSAECLHLITHAVDNNFMHTS